MFEANNIWKSAGICIPCWMLRVWPAKGQDGQDMRHARNIEEIHRRFWKIHEGNNAWKIWGQKHHVHYGDLYWLYCDYFIKCVPCTMVVVTSFVMCGLVYTTVFWQLFGCFCNMCIVYTYTLFCDVCTVFLYCFVYVRVYLFLFVLSVLV